MSESAKVVLVPCDREHRGRREDWEPVGRRREYLDAAQALQTALDRTPWDIETLSVREYDTAPPSWMHRGNHASWFEAQRLRRAILAATNPTRPLSADFRPMPGPFRDQAVRDFDFLPRPTGWSLRVLDFNQLAIRPER